MRNLNEASITSAPENPWRVPAPVLVGGKYGSVIIDRGLLKKAVAASNSYYLFSETGAGVQSVAIVGTELQVMEFLLNNQSQGLESQIKSLPKIYMGISPYTPKDRFGGVFPVNELLVKVAGFLSSLIPVPDWASLIGSPDQLIGLKKTIDGLKPADKAKGELLYVKFSYLPEDKMIQIGNGKVSFTDVLHVIQKTYKKP
jgi:hypothetical protein